MGSYLLLSMYLFSAVFLYGRMGDSGRHLRRTCDYTGAAHMT